VLARDNASLPNLKGAMNSVIRANYSMPPHHGASVVAKILRDPALKKQWMAEVEEMRQRMLGLRLKISEGMRKASNSSDFDFVGEHRGMFSLLVLNDEQIERLREEFGFYIVSGGRINIAGLNDAQIEPFCEAIAETLR
jgi:aspartate/tyrosine/aromatic aminotransferase